MLIESALASAVEYTVRGTTGNRSVVLIAASGTTLALGLLGVAIPQVRLRLWGLFGFRYFWQYPPLWVAVAGAAAYMDFLQFSLFRTSAGAGVPWLGIVAVSCVAVVGALSPLWRLQEILKVKGGVDSDSAASESIRLSDLPVEALIEWAKDDREVTDRNQDLFGHAAVAARIASRIKVNPADVPTMVVVGEPGTGKSSIRNLLEQELGKEPSVVFVNVSLWQYASVNAAVAGILTSLAKAIAERVDATSLYHLPEKYVEAIQGLSGWTGMIRLLGRRRSPEQILERIASILHATGMTVTLYIEDLERFSGAPIQMDQEQRGEASLDEADLCGPIHAVLHLLDQQQRVSVILATASLRDRLDVGKLARYIETPPVPTEEEILTLLHSFRRHCLTNYDYIDPAPVLFRSYLDPPFGIVSWDELRYREHKVINPMLALGRSLRNPRRFKHCVREVIDTWDTLYGEVDFDAVLVATALKLSYPAVFSFLMNNRDAIYFHRGHKGARDAAKGGPGADPALSVQLNEVVERSVSQRDRRDARQLVSYAFAIGGDLSRGILDSSPQSFRQYTHCDYLRRFLAKQAVPERESDQRVLRAIEQWNKSASPELAELLLDEMTNESFDTFAYRVKQGGELALFKEVVSRLSVHSAAPWKSHRGTVPGLTPAWRLVEKSNTLSSEKHSDVCELLAVCMQNNIPLACELYHRCYRSSYRQSFSGTHLFDKGQLEEQYQIMISCLLENYVDKPDRMLAALKDGESWTVFHLVWGAHRYTAGDLCGVPFDGWESVADTLTRMVERDPVSGLRYIVPFITREDSERRIVEYDEDAAKRLFDMSRLLPLFAATPPLQSGSAALLVRYELVQSVASKLRKSSSS
ncbi:MAG: hypothetical protein JJU33_09660 [Phycisphaerales bacterium]|nr:hypothetical protein [Phycisphaerales bacterium]